MIDMGKLFTVWIKIVVLRNVFAKQIILSVEKLDKTR